MTSFRITAAVTLLSAGLAAQTGVGSVRAATHLGAYVGNSRPSYAFVAKGTTRQWSGTTVSLAAHARSNLRDSMSVAATLGRQKSTGAVLAGLAVLGQARAFPGLVLSTSNAASPVNPPPAPVSVLYVHPAKAGTKRGFTFEILPALTPAPFATTVVRAAVDIGDDGNIDWTPPIVDRKLSRRTLTVTAGNRGFVVRLDLQVTHRQLTAGQRSATSVRFGYAIGKRRRCEFALRGKSCGGDLFGFLVADEQARLEVRFSLRNAASVILVGPTFATIPIPGTGCNLYTPPVAHVPHRTNPLGFATLTFPIPPGVVGDVYFQHGAVLPAQGGGLRIQTTNAARLRCVLF